MMKPMTILIIIAIAGIVLFFASVFIVKEQEQVVLVQFGEVVGLVNKPGLHFKIPFVQDAKRFDKRWLEWDGEPSQITTLDKRYIYIEVFARWRISEPLVFIETLRDEVSAQGRLDDIIDNATRNVIANHRLIEAIRSTNRALVYSGEEALYSVGRIDDEIMAAEALADEQEAAEALARKPSDTKADADQKASDDAKVGDGDVTAGAAIAPQASQPATAGASKAPSDKQATNDLTDRSKPYAIEFGRDKLTRLILEKASAKAAQLGIELRDVQIKRINYIETVQSKVFDRMISERKRVAEAYRSEGQGRSAEIIGKMEMELQQIQSEAYRESQKVMGHADAKAAEIYANAYEKDPEFYRFTKTMESYRQTIDEGSWLLLSTESDYVGHLRSMKGNAAD